MSVQEDLLELERRFWTGGESAYLNNLDTDCLVGFTSMAGVSSRLRVVRVKRTQRGIMFASFADPDGNTWALFG